ncbi:sigma-70 family RNA polymerase sigma factor, partial [Streptococcus pyogenes]
GIEKESIRLYTYFKVKFRNYVKDKVRRQESQKRKFDRMNHEDITELSHLVAEDGLLSDEKVLLQDMLESYRNTLGPS